MAEPATPVAVIGMGCRLPGGIDSPDQLWEALLRGDDLVTEIPAGSLGRRRVLRPRARCAGSLGVAVGAFLDDVAGFDAEFFGISEREATAIDPQHRLLLETAWEAVEHAGLDPATAGRIADRRVHGPDARRLRTVAADAGALEGPYGFTGTSFSMASGRISYALGLHGPAITVDTACSSGLIAVHLACRSLHDGESDLALAGGVSVMLEPRKSTSGVGAGHAVADRTLPRVRRRRRRVRRLPRAAWCVLLKRLPDALARRRPDPGRDPRHGRQPGRPHRQHRHPVAGRPGRRCTGRRWPRRVSTPRTVGMVEAHGTGTPVGDPIEYASLAEVYGIDGPCALGSVKTNFGHAPVGVRRPGPDEGDPRAAARRGAAEPALHPAAR